MKPKVLFLCTGNSCRSQMAEGLLRHLAGERYEAASAGTKPSTVNPLAIRAMREIGIDISGHRSKSAAELLGTHYGTIITVCDNAKEQCPVFPGNARRMHWPFDDPAEVAGSDDDRMPVFRRVRDEIRARLERFLRDNE